MELTLTDEESDSNTGKIEAVEPGLDFSVDGFRFPTAFPLQNTLGNCGDGRVVAFLDVFQDLGEAVIVVADLRWPDNSGCLCVISGTDRSIWVYKLPSARNYLFSIGILSFPFPLVELP